ncbi:outer membrane protein [Methylocystis iwaonis]|uniref:Outer-membrane immunogenic protein n=1 Tax=Methylocystis iwaonis TaxID=2885079 RepID=A0ABM8ECD8_9HYPH|nr:outer membrane beta-barrel protein [Methylocystis iwaonis]BDV35688.1 outer-membrane immunogenic protein [Methylocystis iwaonis]
MKKFCLSVAASALMAGSAFAADLPSLKAPPAVAPAAAPLPTWTGFYAGVNAGGTWASDTTATLTQFDGVLVTSAPAKRWGGPQPAPAPGQWAWFSGGQGFAGIGNRSGFIGGGQVGYNYQFYQNFLVGLEADIQGVASGGGDTTLFGVLPLPSGFSVSQFTRLSGSLDYLGTVRGRLGWLVMPTLLLYGTGGFAYGGVTLNASTLQILNPTGQFGAGFSSFSDTATGWTAGGGLEWMFMPNWSAKVEYLYYDLGTIHTFGGAGIAFTPVPTWSFAATTPVVSAPIRGNIVRAGVNYHFNWGSAPVLASF